VAVLTAILTSDSEALTSYRRIIEMAENRILPANQCGRGLVDIFSKGALLMAVQGRRENVLTQEFSLLSGIVSGPGYGDEPGSWWTLDGPVPDGSFTLIRGDSDKLMAITDYAGSRSVWHAKLGCGGIVVSTSFELIIALLGDFDLDTRALGWFLSSGTTGPGRSWDKRVKPLLRDSRLEACCADERVTVSLSKVEREPVSMPPYDTDRLRGKLLETIADFKFGDRPWLMGLSGGYDSRAILSGARHIQNLRCITWVDEGYSGNGDSDADIAARLAAEAGREHEVKIIRRPTSAADLDAAIRRFVRYCDGRTDNVLGYVDGMVVWDEMSSGEFGGLLRGDELFGSTVASQESRVRHNMNLDSFHDFASSPEQRDLVSRYGHEFPRSLRRKSSESLSHWRLRLRSDFEIPSVYASLNNLRNRFFESCCPLLERRLVQTAASIEGHELDERAMYKQAVGALYPDIPIAVRRSTLDQQTFMRFPQTAEVLKKHLEQDFARDVLGSRCIQAAYASIHECQEAAVPDNENHGGARVRGKSVPLWLRRLKRKLDPPLKLDMATVVLRSYLAMVMVEEMNEAASLGISSCEKQKRSTG
jgi:hypothetical protein